MKLPIYVYGSPVLRKVAADVEQNDDSIKELIDNMFETMENADGVGLAAPQVGVSKRIFIIDAEPMSEDDPSLKDFKKIFINPKIVEEKGKEWVFNEGCLSIPGIREDISRKDQITIEYYDENFESHSEKYDGIKARIIQHEYDHLEGIMFPDHLNALKKKLLKTKLMAITKGRVSADYKIKFPR